MSIIIGMIIVIGVVCVLGMLICVLIVGSIEGDKMEKDLKNKRSKHGHRK